MNIKRFIKIATLGLIILIIGSLAEKSSNNSTIIDVANADIPAGGGGGDMGGSTGSCCAGGCAGSCCSDGSCSSSY
jgi:uncharacterized spore protein YtfJ